MPAIGKRGLAGHHAFSQEKSPLLVSDEVASILCSTIPHSNGPQYCGARFVSYSWESRSVAEADQMGACETGVP